MKPSDLYILVALLLIAVSYWLPWMCLYWLFPEVAQYLSITPSNSWTYLKKLWIDKEFLYSLRDVCVNELNMPLIKYKLHLLGARIIPVGVAPSLIAFCLYYKKRIEDRIVQSKTSAAYATLHDISEFLGTDGVVLTKNVRLREPECYEHIAVIGPTGSGKTASYFLPNLLALREKQSAVVFDPKGELYQQTFEHHKKFNKKSYLLKLDNHYNSICWNPLDVPKDAVEMNKVCQSIVKNKGGDQSGGGGDQDFWDATAIDLLLACVYSVKSIPPSILTKVEKIVRDENGDPVKDKNGNTVYERDPQGNIIYEELMLPKKTYGNFRNIYMMLAELSFEAMIGLAKFSASELGQEDQISRTKSFSDAVAPEETRNSTRFVLKTALNPFTTPSVAYVTATTDVKFEALKENPSLLFVSIPEHKVDGVKPVLATLYMQIFDSLLNMGKSGCPVFFFLDEFANSGKILGFSQYIATVRSRKLSLSVCLQSPKQLEQAYSEAEKNAILNNLKTWLVLPGLKEETSLKYISEISGKIGYMERENMQSDKRAMEKEKLPVAEIRMLEDNPKKNLHEAIVIMKNKSPYKDTQRRFYLDPEFKKLLADRKDVDFPQNDERKFKNIEEECFFDAGDLKFLEEVGIALSTELNAQNISPDKISVYGKVIKRFNERYNGGEFPEILEVEEPDGRRTVEVEWIQEVVDNALNDKERTYIQNGRLMFSKTLRWLHSKNLYVVPPPKEARNER